MFRPIVQLVLLIGVAAAGLLSDNELPQGPAEAAPSVQVPPGARLTPGGGHDLHEVQRCENLFRIALRYDTTVDHIKAENGLVDDLIFVGQRLHVGAGGTGHRIMVGDTVYVINARAVDVHRSPDLSVSWREDVLLTVPRGQRLRVYAPAVHTAGLIWWPVMLGDGAEGAVAGYVADSTPGGVPVLRPVGRLSNLSVVPHSEMFEHSVKAGETLACLSNRYGTSVAEIMRVNGLADTRIAVGQRIFVMGLDIDRPLDSVVGEVANVVALAAETGVVIFRHAERNTRSANWSAETMFGLGASGRASAAQLRPGQMIEVVGIPQGDGAISAWEINIIDMNQ